MRRDSWLCVASTTIKAITHRIPGLQKLLSPSKRKINNAGKPAATSEQPAATSTHGSTASTAAKATVPARIHAGINGHRSLMIEGRCCVHANNHDRSYRSGGDKPPSYNAQSAKCIACVKQLENDVGCCGGSFRNVLIWTSGQSFQCSMIECDAIFGYGADPTDPGDEMEPKTHKPQR